MKVLSVAGARPQFIKAAPVSRILRKEHVEVLVHTGQHYDDNMSNVFFRELGIPAPDINLEVGSGSHGRQTAQMLERIERVVLAEKPDWVLVYGDTNSTLAGALAAVKLGVSLAHVEAGLRSYNRTMPEEHNRVLTDHCSDLLFCPTETAVRNLAKEGIQRGVHFVGDTMYDAVLMFRDVARERSTVLKDLDLKPKQYLLATVHRPYNTDSQEGMANILAALQRLGEIVVFPVHPRTREAIRRFGLQPASGNLRLMDPVGYLDMLMFEENARLILTDSGGMQKEAYFFAVPCVTLRPETEWVETTEGGWNVVVNTDPDAIASAVRTRDLTAASPAAVFGSGRAARAISKLLTGKPGA